MKYFTRTLLAAALVAVGFAGNANAQLQSAAFDNEISAADVTCYTFNSSLSVGSQGGDVMALQIFLAQNGFLTFPAGQTPNINSYFGRLTKAAVVKYQTSVGISPSGYVGPLTRARINKEFSCQEGSAGSSTDGSGNSSSQSNEEAQVRAYASNGNSAAMIIGKPTISIERGINNEETSLVARFEMLVAAQDVKDAPITISGQQYYVQFEGKANGDGSVRSLTTQVIPGKNVTVTKDQYGQTAYAVSRNGIGRFTLIGRVNTKELFAGPYRARIYPSIYATQGEAQSIMIQVVNAGSKVTESVSIMGEVSPYLSSASVDASNTNVLVRGVRFSTNSTSKVTIYSAGNVLKSFAVNASSPTLITFPAAYLPATNADYYLVTVTDSALGDKAGLSNPVNLNVKGGPVPSGTTGSSSGQVVRIDYITPSPAPLGSKIKISGVNFGGFEGDYIVSLKRVSDGMVYELYDANRTNEGRTNNGEMVVTLKEPCKYGETIYGSYSGIAGTCKLTPMTPGEYIVSMKPWGVTSNQYKLVITDPSVVVSPSGISVESRVVDVGSNYVGYWGVWQPGIGNANKTADDWHWAVRITAPRDIVVKTVTITNANGEGWSTSDTTKVQGVPTYPLKFMSSSQENKGANERLTLKQGANVINFWGQVESSVYSGGKITLTFEDGSSLSGDVPASTIRQGSTVSNTTSSQITTQAAVAPQQDTIEAHVVDASSDYVGIWGNWKPGVGNSNPTNKDWHWAARLVTTNAKTIQSVTVTNGNEAWSTAETQIGGIPTYPLKFMSSAKTNTVANERFDVAAGATVFNVWGQVERSEYAGGTIRVIFTDGTSVSAQIPSSPIKASSEPIKTTTTPTAGAVITEGIVSSNVTSGLPGSSVTLKLAGVKTPVTANDINIGPYAAQNLVFNATTNEVTFTIPWDMVVGTYDIVWFGPSSTYTMKFYVANKSSFQLNAETLVGSVLTVIKSLF